MALKEPDLEHAENGHRDRQIDGCSPISFAGQRLHIEYWPIGRPQDYERNPRKNDKAVDRMVASIVAYGFAIPVLALSTGTVVDGHLRLKAARKLGMTEVPVIRATAGPMRR